MKPRFAYALIGALVLLSCNEQKLTHSELVGAWRSTAVKLRNPDFPDDIIILPKRCEVMVDLLLS
ncbi:hypothetical protein [Hymenobacter guriensis]|uniref:Lipocalin-like domain-containing protein n=1 Tax=Hymenobacter guriensis TaxID=2793065 RepID=A0ABS0KZW2_9BACT|nr:hypothetical protein [Hymenobacter guriensis]MBG8552734.1 hypothetical protein [Hymenobacter guriensis]